MSIQSTKIYLKEGWFIKSSSQVYIKDKIVSSNEFIPVDWYPATIPTTVLNALVKNGVYPDPRIGLNNFLIPDASDEFNEEHSLAKYSYLPDKRNPWKDPYWFRTEFMLPKNCKTRQWLVFNAINYRAEVWFNGKLIAGSEDMAGAFLRFRYDVTDCVKPGETNYLAVKIYCVDHVGVPGTQLVPFQPPRISKDGYDLKEEIMKDVTFTLAAVGYDCAPEVCDRLMGIWQDVYIECTGPVIIRDPFLITKLPLPRTDYANLTFTAKLANASDTVQKGTLIGIIEGKVKFEKDVELDPAEIKEIVFSPDEYPRLRIDKPRLWWPAGYGEQNLYDLQLSFEIDGETSDEERVTFGIREVTKVLYELDGEYGLRLHINGEKVFCRGGYLMTDTLLDSIMMGKERFESELRYLKEANLNTFSMEDIPNLPDVFFDLCDKSGLMYWNCFYQNHWITCDDHPLDHDLLEKCTIDIIKRYRNHPSIVVYMCANEGVLAKDQYGRWRRNVMGLDGTRVLVTSGYFDWRNPEFIPEWIKQETPVGVNDSEPKSYTWQQHSWYYNMVREDRTWMFKIESGSASLPPIESIKKIIPDFGDIHAGAVFPLNRTWAHHGANEYYLDYDRAIRRRFWEPDSLEDYCRIACIVTADQHRAMFEAVNHLKWDVTSGFLQWKLNSCWPDVQWQLYDYYLRPMVSLYYVKKACEPLHVQLNPSDMMVTVVNNYLEPKDSLNVKAGIYDFDMKLAWEKNEKVDIERDYYKNAFVIPRLSELTPVYFIKLELEDTDNSFVSDNFYWLSAKPDDSDIDCLADLRKLPAVRLNVSYDIEINGDEGIINVKLKNPTDKLAFFIRVIMTKGNEGEEILPVYWDDNYFSLLPGEDKANNAVFAIKDLGEAKPGIKVEGWNIQATVTAG